MPRGRKKEDLKNSEPITKDEFKKVVFKKNSFLKGIGNYFAGNQYSIKADIADSLIAENAAVEL